MNEQDYSSRSILLPIMTYKEFLSFNQDTAVIHEECGWGPNKKICLFDQTYHEHSYRFSQLSIISDVIQPTCTHLHVLLWY